MNEYLIDILRINKIKQKTKKTKNIREKILTLLFDDNLLCIIFFLFLAYLRNTSDCLFSGIFFGSFSKSRRKKNIIQF